jgi:hypothetical protein
VPGLSEACGFARYGTPANEQRERAGVPGFELDGESSLPLGFA